MIEFKLDKKFKADSSFSLSVNGEAKKGSIICIYGPSGSGKTTLLRLLAGLEVPDQGFIKVNAKVWEDSLRKTRLKSNKRSIGFVFQDYALFPNMTVLGNLKFACHRKEDINNIPELTELLEINDLLSRMPQNLSGGEKQRVALARALVRKPEVLLLDEPLAALDRTLKSKIQDYLSQISKKLEPIIFMVSHDLAEIFKLSDEVWKMQDGKIIDKAKAENLFAEHTVSGKFQIPGDVIAIQKQDVVYVISVLTSKNIIKVVATEKEIQDLAIGDKVIVASKAFNPIILKVN